MAKEAFGGAASATVGTPSTTTTTATTPHAKDISLEHRDIDLDYLPLYPLPHLPHLPPDHQGSTRTLPPPPPQTPLAHLTCESLPQLPLLLVWLQFAEGSVVTDPEISSDIVIVKYGYCSLFSLLVCIGLLRPAHPPKVKYSMLL